jgi:hypothetical protein
VFVGCEYTKLVGSARTSSILPSATAGGVIKAYVVDDPNVLFQVQADGAMDQSDNWRKYVLPSRPIYIYW